MAAVTAGRTETQPLSRDRILDVALAVASDEGLEALSMRRVASELGTGAMSLYNHVPDKQALLDGLAERVLTAVEAPSGSGWREVATTWATSVRRTMLDHRRLVPLLVTPQRPAPLLAMAASAVQALESTGLSADDARHVTRLVARFVAGSVMVDAASTRRGGPPRAQLDETFDLGLEAMLSGLEAQLT
jgi:AcrR family transcriptional regulator